MKKFYYSLLTATMLLATTSCSQEEDFGQQSSGELTTFSVSLDGETGSRAAGDGKSVNKLYYAVYDQNTANVIYPANAKYGVADKVSGGWTVELPLMKSETYDILFWAQVDGTQYYEFTELTDIKVKYDNVLSNIEDRDAFFNALDDFTASGSKHTIVLRRPFAQLNVATTLNDWTDAQKITGETNPVTASTVKVSSLATNFNAMTGAATNPATVEFKANNLIDETISITRAGETEPTEYKLLAMNYLLPEGEKTPNGLGNYSAAELNTDKDVVEVEFTLYKGQSEQIVNVKVPSTPIQRNYRTNIIGDLLTGEHFDIIVDADFDNEENQEITISAEGIVKDAEGIYHITKPEGLWALANLVNNGSQGTTPAARAASVGYDFDNVTFVLDSDVDLQGAEWEPIGNGKTYFGGTFDGKNYTVSNFKVTEKEGYVGLFGRVHIGEVKNVKVKDVTINAHHYAGGVVGQGYVKIENCHAENVNITITPKKMDNSTYDWGDKAGGIIGQNCEGASFYVKGCTAKNVSVTGYRDLGGIVGMAQYGNTVSNNKVEGITIVKDFTNGYEKEQPTTFGAVIGRKGVKGDSTVTESDNSDETAATFVEINGEDYKGYYVDANGNYVATESEGISAILEEDKTEINLADGNFIMPTDGLQGKKLTFAGSRNAELDLTPVAGNYQNVSGATLTFDGITVKYGNDNYKGMQHAAAVTYTDCVINGLQFLYAPTTFTNCDLNSNGAEHCVWTYGANEVSFTGCTFTYGDRAVNCYLEDPKDNTAIVNVTFSGCEFTKVDGKETTGAIETNSCFMKQLNLNITNCTVNEGDLWWISEWDSKQGANTVVTIDGTTVHTYDAEGNRLVFASNSAELDAAITNALSEDSGKKTIITLATGTYSDDIALTLATRTQTGDLVFKAAQGAEPVIAGTVTLGYRNQGVGAAMWNSNVTFEGVTFDHAKTSNHSISIGDVNCLNLINCKIIGDGEYGISCDRGNASTGSITGCTFENAGMQLLGNFATDLVIEQCIFNESRINVQAGNGVTVQNCNFTNTLTAANVNESFYLIRSNSTPITVNDCKINIDSELAEVAAEQTKWGILWNHGTTNWTVENVAVTMTDAALKQTELLVTKCTSTDVKNTNKLTVNNNTYASNASQLTSAVNAGATDIWVEGEINMPGSGTSNEITFKSNGTGCINLRNIAPKWDSAKLTFKNINFKTNFAQLSDYSGLYSYNMTCEECTFDGPMLIGRDNATFIKCIFNNLGNDYIRTYGNAAKFQGCTFNSDGKALLIYSDGNGDQPNVTVSGCTFNATTGAKAGAIANQNCAAIEIDNYGCGVNLTTSGNTIDSDFSGEWRLKKYYTGKEKVTVNETEYTTIALDGKTMTIDANNNVTVNQ